MSFSRIRISKDATTRLHTLKIRTGLTPNILARIGLCLSLAERGTPDGSIYDEEGLEFNRFTLTGEFDLFFLALLRERLVKDGLDPSSVLLSQFKAHLNRGVMTLGIRVRSLADLQTLLPDRSSDNPTDTEVEADIGD